MTDNLTSSDVVGVTKEFEEYARPLIIGELYLFIVDGLPIHLNLSDKIEIKETTQTYETFRN